MDNNIKLRHSKLHEQFLFNIWTKLLFGIVFVALLPFFILNVPIPLSLNNDYGITTLIANSIAFTTSFYFLRKLKPYPGSNSFYLLLPIITISWLSIFSILLFMRVDYSRPVLLTAYGFACIWVMVAYFLSKRYSYLKLALVPFGRISNLESNDKFSIHPLEKPTFGNRRFDGVIVDLRADDLPAEWQRFLAHCALADVPVYHYRQLLESYTGKVSIKHLSENALGGLQPSKTYGAIKQVLDFIFALILLPLIAPILIITAILIRLESKGNALFVQERVGYNNKLFKIYKFRSMYIDVEGTAFTSEEDDPRITKIGRVIRKYRIDELPQIFNILKGDMSFIGPRPESKDLAYWYEQDVPFFSYRHVVKPGISGWAQVMQGYAAEVDGMTVKVEYDLYYIKYYSVYLDILVTIKTIRTILTGFGAR